MMELVEINYWKLIKSAEIIVEIMLKVVVIVLAMLVYRFINIDIHLGNF